MQDMYTNEDDTESPVKQGISSIAKAIGFVAVFGLMWFTYTSVLPSIPVIGPILELTSAPPPPDIGDVASRVADRVDSSTRSDGQNVVTGGSDSILGDAGLQETIVKDAATERRLIAATEVLLGAPLAGFGINEASYIEESYRWCASIQAYGRSGAYELLREEAERIFPENEIEARWALAVSGNQLIEEYLCS